MIAEIRSAFALKLKNEKEETEMLYSEQVPSS